MQAGGGRGPAVPPAARAGQGQARRPSGTVAVGELGGKGRGENVSIKGSFPLPRAFCLPLAPGGDFSPSCQHGLVPTLAFCLPTSRRGQRVETASDSPTSSCWPWANPAPPSVPWDLLAISRVTLGSALGSLRARETEARSQLQLGPSGGQLAPTGSLSDHSREVPRSREGQVHSAQHRVSSLDAQHASLCK